MTTMTMNFGPQHPAAHGVLRLVLELDGEVIIIKLSLFVSLLVCAVLPDLPVLIATMCVVLGYYPC